VRLLARVGEDPAAEVALRAARAAGVDLALVQRDPTIATGLCFAAISPGGERTFFSARGANAALARPLDALAGIGWLHVAGHALLEGAQRETTLALLAEAELRGVPASLDLCLPLLRAARGEVIALGPQLAVLFANELELRALDAEEAAFPLLAAKLGARGSRLFGRVRAEAAPFEVAARDSTGAGDAYVGAFLVALGRGAEPTVAARIGNAAGALTTSRVGAAAALPRDEELCAFLDARGAACERRALETR
jgi:sugar/nucleoside kinase (ribokinase family)